MSLPQLLALEAHLSTGANTFTWTQLAWTAELSGHRSKAKGYLLEAVRMCTTDCPVCTLELLDQTQESRAPERGHSQDFEDSRSIVPQHLLDKWRRKQAPVVVLSCSHALHKACLTEMTSNGSLRQLLQRLPCSSHS